jgi:hypothetical protein
MKFLFHTIILFDNKPVYYNVYGDEKGFFAEILDNPAKIRAAGDFDLRRECDSWVSSHNINNSILQVLGEEIESQSLA